MLEIDGYDITLVAGESALIEFEVEPIDLGELSDNIDGYFDVVEGSKNPCFSYIYANSQRKKSFKLNKIGEFNFVLKLNSLDTQNLKHSNFWGLRFTNGENSVIPLVNQRLFARRLGYGKSSCLPSSDK